jgi:hypothetical protein
MLDAFKKQEESQFLIDCALQNVLSSKIVSQIHFEMFIQLEILN